MTISGKSALRKNRFKGPLLAGYQPNTPLKLRGMYQIRVTRPGVFDGDGADQVWIKHAHVGQIAVPLGEIEPVADHEPVRDLEADVADGNIDLAPAGLGQEGADLEARGLTRLEVAEQVRERQPRVDDVLDDEHVAVLDVDVEVLEDADDARGVGRCAVARDGHEVDLAGHGQVAHQVGHEEDGALQHADQQQVAAAVVGGDLLAELGNARGEPLLVDQDLA